MLAVEYFWLCFTEYDIPTANDSAMEHNSFDLNTSSAQESVPGLAMGVSTASSSSLPVPTAEGNWKTLKNNRNLEAYDF